MKNNNIKRIIIRENIVLGGHKFYRGQELFIEEKRSLKEVIYFAKVNGGKVTYYKNYSKDGNGSPDNSLANLPIKKLDHGKFIEVPLTQEVNRDIKGDGLYQVTIQNQTVNGKSINSVDVLKLQ